MHTNQMGVRAPGALEDAYLEAAQVLAGMVHRHQFPLGGDRRVPWVSPRVGDGMIRVNQAGMITFASPNALSAYRRLGLTSDLYGEDFVAVTRSLLKERAPVERPIAASLRRTRLGGDRPGDRACQRPAAGPAAERRGRP